MDTQILYLDTNIFDHIQKGWIGEEVIKRLEEGISHGKSEIVLSYLNIEEALSNFETDRNHGIEVLRHIFRLANTDKLIKQDEDLIRDGIHAFLNNESDPSPFIPMDPIIKENLSRLVTSSSSISEELEEVMRATKEQKENFQEQMRQARIKMKPAVEALRGDHPSFYDYWNALCLNFAEGFAEKAGFLSECKARGIELLLENRTIRMAVGIALSFSYAQDLEGREPKISDSRDLKHAVLAASASNCFITHDSKFARILKRVPIDNFQILRLDELTISL